MDVRGILQIWHERKNEFQIKAEYIGLSRLENGEARQSEWINQLKQKLRRYEDRGFLAKVWDLFKEGDFDISMFRFRPASED